MDPQPRPAFAWAGANKAFGKEVGDDWERRRRISFPFITSFFLQAARDPENTGR